MMRIKTADDVSGVSPIKKKLAGHYPPKFDGQCQLGYDTPTENVDLSIFKKCKRKMCQLGKNRCS